jgi:hypothetical protein
MERALSHFCGLRCPPSGDLFVRTIPWLSLAVLTACPGDIGGMGGGGGGGGGGGASNGGGSGSIGGGSAAGGGTSASGGGVSTGGGTNASGGGGTSASGGGTSASGGGTSACDGGGTSASGGGGTSASGGGGTSASGGGTNASGGGTSATGGGGTSASGGGTASAGLLDPDYTTTWNPGILADTTGAALGADGLPVRTMVCASVPMMSGDAANAIQSALDGCTGTNKVVTLAAGTYNVSMTVTVPSGVVLRGAGSDASNGTVIASTNGGPVLAIGTMQDTVCYDGSGFASGSKPLLTQDALKETSTVHVASANGFAAGDMAMLDETDSSEVSEGDCTSTFKRGANLGVSERVEIQSVSGTTLTLSTPLHWTFKTSRNAHLSKVSHAATKWAGIESLVVRNGRPGGYPGQNAGGIDVSNAAYSWLKDVQVDGTNSGMPIRLAGTFRCVVRDSHVHNSSSYGFGQDNYGIVLACGAADNLVENNVVRFVNKPILFNVSGGGNVVGYNYADNSWACDGNNDDGFQEVQIDCHCAFPHMELMEGNWAPHMGASTTHGNAGYLTYFRNYASTQFTHSVDGQATSAIIWSQPFVPQYANVEALQFDSPDLKMTVVGNVLGSTTDSSQGMPMSLGTTSSGQGAAASTSATYVGTNGGLKILDVDQSTVSWTTLWLHGNYDTVNKQTMWNAAPPTMNLPMSARTLPPSLYYSSKPAWWPAGKAWPWVGPDLTPKVGALPAKDRSDAFSYMNASDPACTLDCGNYCCHAGSGCSL